LTSLTIASSTVLATCVGTWHVPTRLCPPPPYLSISEPTSTLEVLLMMLCPQVMTTFFWCSPHMTYTDMFWSGKRLYGTNRLPVYISC